MTLISHTRQFIFFHFPKNAGNSIYRALDKYRDDEFYQALGRHNVSPFCRKMIGFIERDLQNGDTYESLKLPSKAILKMALSQLVSKTDWQDRKQPKRRLTTLLRKPFRFAQQYRLFVDNSYPRFLETGQHHTPGFIRKTMPDIFQKYFKFAIVRNPYDWVVSAYRFFSQSPGEELYELFRSFNDFEHFINHISEHDIYSGNIKTAVMPSYAPQRNFLYDDSNGPLVDFVARFENLQNDFDMVCDKIGIPSVELGHHNKSNHHEFEAYYSPTLRNRIYELFKTDFETFGYSK